MITLNEIKAILVGHKVSLMERFKIKELAIFGSFLRGEETQNSDVDLLVEFSEPVSFFAFLDLEEYLQKLLGRKVDLVTKKALKPRIGKAILKEMIRI